MIHFPVIVAVYLTRLPSDLVKGFKSALESLVKDLL